MFIVLAIFGLHLLAAALGDAFVFIQYLGGAYLVWLGIRLWRSGATAAVEQKTADVSAWSSFMTGLLPTLGDNAGASSIPGTCSTNAPSPVRAGPARCA